MALMKNEDQVIEFWLSVYVAYNIWLNSLKVQRANIYLMLKAAMKKISRASNESQFIDFLYHVIKI